MLYIVVCTHIFSFCMACPDEDPLLKCVCTAYRNQLLYMNLSMTKNDYVLMMLMMSFAPSERCSSELSPLPATSATTLLDPDAGIASTVYPPEQYWLPWLMEAQGKMCRGEWCSQSHPLFPPTWKKWKYNQQSNLIYYRYYSNTRNFTHFVSTHWRTHEFCLGNCYYQTLFFANWPWNQLTAFFASKKGCGLL